MKLDKLKVGQVIVKQVISVSLGSSKRDKTVDVALLGQNFRISRVGTDGSFKKMRTVLRELDGNVDAIGLGGIDVFLFIGSKRYAIRDGLKLMNIVQKTPVVDGSFLKQTLEKKIVHFLARDTKLVTPSSKVLMVSAADRFGMAQAFQENGCPMVFGDLMFALGIPLPIRSLGQLERLAHIALPLITQLPFRILYPTGSKQDLPDNQKKARFSAYYREADIIAGDFHFIRRYLPSALPGKTIVTNTTTEADVQLLKERGVSHLVTTTPQYEGRSFGTNVLEGVLLTLVEKPWREVTLEDYNYLIDKLELKPQITKLN